MRELDWQSEFEELIRSEYAARKKRNSRFSLRSFATKIGISSGALSDIINEKKAWKFSAERAEEILKKMDVDSHIINRFRAKMGRALSFKEAIPLNPVDYDILVDWAVYPILFAHDLPAPLCTAPALARRLDLPVSKVEEIIRTLVEKKLLLHSGDRLVRSFYYLKADSQSPEASANLMRSHLEGLELVKKVLRERPKEERDVTASVFLGSLDQMAEAKKLIEDFHNRMVVIMDKGNGSADQIFRLSIQLFAVNFEK